MKPMFPSIPGLLVRALSRGYLSAVPLLASLSLILFILVLIFLVARPVYILMQRLEDSNVAGTVGIFVFGLVALPVLYASFFFIWFKLLEQWDKLVEGRVWRWATPTGGSLMRWDSRKPVLYLRSFATDLDGVEKTLTPVLELLGPVVAIGGPRGQLHPIGAARFFAGHEDWKDLLRDLSGRASLVVWRFGLTKNLLWELSFLSLDARLKYPRNRKHLPVIRETFFA
jgi:hypothetical protein